MGPWSRVACGPLGTQWELGLQQAVPRAGDGRGGRQWHSWPRGQRTKSGRQRNLGLSGMEGAERRRQIADLALPASRCSWEGFQSESRASVF